MKVSVRKHSYMVIKTEDGGYFEVYRTPSRAYGGRNAAEVKKNVRD